MLTEILLQEFPTTLARPQTGWKKVHKNNY